MTTATTTTSSSTTTSSETATSSSGTAVEMVPDSLLAMAKDSRYVKECQSLMLQILQTFLPRRRYALLEQESWILASLFCLALGLTRTANKVGGTAATTTSTKTLGMETVGLHFPATAQRWKFVLAALGTFSWAFVFSPDRTTMAQGSRRSGQGGVETIRQSSDNHNHHNDGTSTQRRRSSSLRPTVPLVPSSEGTTQQNDEMLRGNSRRQFYEAQRQAMLRRANLAVDTNDNGTATQADPNSNLNAVHEPVGTEHSARHQSQDAPSVPTSILKRVKAIFFQMAQILSAAVLSPSEGPHTLIGETQQHHNQQRQSPSATIHSIGKWLAKLQLAHFCLTGRYPTWIHRFSGHPLIGSTDVSSSRLYHRPNTARLIGLLIGVQAMVSLLQAMSSSISRWLLEQESRRQQQQSALASSSTTVPPVVFDNESTEDPSRKTRQRQRSRGICSICRMERTHPAAPSSCGHVACWNCLIQWVSTVRPACPLCRAACRPQDIVALYNYEPSI